MVVAEPSDDTGTAAGAGTKAASDEGELRGRARIRRERVPALLLDALGAARLRAAPHVLGEGELSDELLGAVREVLSSLTPREQEVLVLRYGLEDGRTRTLEEVGRRFGVTRERIRQIEAKALRKLRHPSRNKKLKDCLR